MGDDVLRMAECGLLVAAVVVPLGLVGWRLARRPLLPPWRPWGVGWTGFEVLVAFLVVSTVIPQLVLAGVSRSGLLADDGSPRAVAIRALVVGVAAFPVQLAVLLIGRSLYPSRPGYGPGGLPGRVAVGVLVWAGLTPAVLLVHGGVSWLFRELGWTTVGHPLSELTDGPAWQAVLFLFQAGVAAPVVEELVFRGVLLGWLVGGRSLRLPAATDRPAADRRVWWVLAVGVLVAATPARGPEFLAPGPATFAVGLLVGWVVLRQVFRRKRRTLGAVYASAALFAEVHSAVWPSPIPLFVLGLGLGWLAVRTRGVLAPVIVHGLFNAVSVLYVLRGGS